MTTFRPHRPRLGAIPTRVGQGLAVTALMAGLTIGASAVANAEWDIGAYDKCTDAADLAWGSRRNHRGNITWSTTSAARPPVGF